jgi:CW-type Zinc Finger
VASAKVPPSSAAAPVLVNITWVECHNCHKWRKVPGHVNEADLPEVWTCSQNYWAPLYATCAAKEEEAGDSKLVASSDDIVNETLPPLTRSSSTNVGKKGARIHSGAATIPPETTESPTKKVTQ